MSADLPFVSLNNPWSEERALRALQTAGRLMAAVELIWNASRTEGFDGHVQREADLQGTAQDLIELARQIVSNGEATK